MGTGNGNTRDKGWGLTKELAPGPVPGGRVTGWLWPRKLGNDSRDGSCSRARNDWNLSPGHRTGRLCSLNVLPRAVGTGQSTGVVTRGTLLSWISGALAAGLAANQGCFCPRAGAVLAPRLPALGSCFPPQDGVLTLLTAARACVRVGTLPESDVC